MQFQFNGMDCNTVGHGSHRGSLQRLLKAEILTPELAGNLQMEDTTGFCKVIAERGTGRILGAHVMGPQASTVIQPLVQAMAFGLGAREMATGQYWIHPALPEVVENALLGLDL